MSVVAYISVIFTNLNMQVLKLTLYSFIYFWRNFLMSILPDVFLIYTPAGTFCINNRSTHALSESSGNQINRLN